MIKPIEGPPPARQQIFLRGQFCGEVSRPWSWRTETGGAQFSSPFALICPVCLEVWAMVIDLDRAGPFLVMTEACEVHEDYYGQVPGSLFPRYGSEFGLHDPLLLEALPRALKQREFELHLKELAT